MKKSTFNSLILAGLLISVSATSHGALLFSQGVDSLTVGNLNGQAGFSAMTDAQIVTGGLSYSNGDITVAGGSQHISTAGLVPGNNVVYSNTFAAQSGTVYFSIVMDWTNQGNDDFLFFGLSDAASSSILNSGGLVIHNQGTAEGTVSGRIRNDGFANTTTTSTGFDFGINTSSPVMIVGSLSKVASTNYNTLNLWVNPSSLTEGVSDLTVTRDMGIASGLDTLYFFSGAANENDEVLGQDNILIGTTYETVVPEPGSFGLILGLAFSVVVLLRRRR